MSATGSSLARSSQSLQQPLPEGTRSYITRLAEEIDRRGNGITDDDLWEAHERLRGVPRDTIRVRIYSLNDFEIVR